jgi:hypothetical protein
LRSFCSLYQKSFSQHPNYHLWFGEFGETSEILPISSMKKLVQSTWLGNLQDKVILCSEECARKLSAILLIGGGGLQTKIPPSVISQRSLSHYISELPYSGNESAEGTAARPVIMAA